MCYLSNRPWGGEGLDRSLLVFVTPIPTLLWVLSRFPGVAQASLLPTLLCRDLRRTQLLWLLCPQIASTDVGNFQDFSRPPEQSRPGIHGRRVHTAEHWNNLEGAVLGCSSLLSSWAAAGICQDPGGDCGQSTGIRVHGTAPLRPLLLRPCFHQPWCSPPVSLGDRAGPAAGLS